MVRSRDDRRREARKLILLVTLGLVGLLFVYAMMEDSRMMELLTAALVVITSLYALTTFKILKANEHTVDVMREQAEASWQREKRRRVFELFDYYTLNADSRAVWKEIGILRRKWREGDQNLLPNLVKHFVDLSGDGLSEEPSANGLTPHVNLSVTLHFWSV